MIVTALLEPSTSVKESPHSSVVIFVRPPQEYKRHLQTLFCFNRKKDYPWPFTASLSLFLGKRVIYFLPPVQVDVFTVKAIDLGELKKLRIRHDNSGASPSWFLERVEIVDLKESTT